MKIIKALLIVMLFLSFTVCDNVWGDDNECNLAHTYINGTISLTNISCQVGPGCRMMFRIETDEVIVTLPAECNGDNIDIDDGMYSGFLDEDNNLIVPIIPNDFAQCFRDRRGTDRCFDSSVEIFVFKPGDVK